MIGRKRHDGERYLWCLMGIDRFHSVFVARVDVPVESVLRVDLEQLGHLDLERL